MTPLAVSSFTATSAIGRGLEATLASLLAQRSGLARCNFGRIRTTVRRTLKPGAALGPGHETAVFRGIPAWKTHRSGPRPLHTGMVAHVFREANRRFWLTA